MGISIRWVVAAGLVGALGCGSDGGSGDPNAPRLANPTLAFAASAAHQALCAAYGFERGYLLQARFSGDVVGGTLHVVGEFKPSGARATLDYAIPTSDGITVVTDGVDNLELRGCLTPGSEKSFHAEAWVASSSGTEGNHVTASLPLQ